MKVMKIIVNFVIELEYKVFDCVQSFICVGWKILQKYGRNLLWQTFSSKAGKDK